jgi:hypothetical protein
MAGRFRGPGGFARPENALKRSEELEKVGQRNAALQVLHDIITSKKHRTWSKTYEAIMFRHIDLVVDMRKRNYGKEALMQYRNMCQAVNISSLEEVIKYYLRKASEKAEEAQSKAAVSRCAHHGAALTSGWLSVTGRGPRHRAARRRLLSLLAAALWIRLAAAVTCAACVLAFVLVCK